LKDRAEGRRPEVNAMKPSDRYVTFLTTMAIVGWLLPRLRSYPTKGPGAELPPKDTPTQRASYSGQKDEVKSSPEEALAGAAAEGPSEIPPKGWWHVLKRVAVGFSEDRVMTEAAGVTFYTLLALFPAIASFISIYGLFADPARLNDQMQSLGGIIPGGGLDIIKAQITSLTSNGQQALGVGAIIGLATSLWSANAGMKSLLGALNAVYHEREGGASHGSRSAPSPSSLWHCWPSSPCP
jgi:membrane protein